MSPQFVFWVSLFSCCSACLRFRRQPQARTSLFLRLLLFFFLSVAASLVGPSSTVTFGWFHPHHEGSTPSYDVFLGLVWFIKGCVASCVFAGRWCFVHPLICALHWVFWLVGGEGGGSGVFGISRLPLHGGAFRRDEFGPLFEADEH